MSQTQCNETQVMAQYNRAYSNAEYCEISKQVAVILSAGTHNYTMICTPEQQAHHEFMNLLIDACFEMCGHKFYQGRIVLVCADAVEMGADIAVMVDQYLGRFS